eukprot:s6640_g2.t1
MRAAACTACFLVSVALLLLRRCSVGPQRLGAVLHGAAPPAPPGLRPWADRSLQVFGVLVAASPGVAPETLRHAASILAEFLDQDQDGVADVPEVTRQLQEHQALILILADEDEYLAGAGAVEGLGSKVIKNDNPSWNCSVRDVFVFSELFQTETGCHEEGEDAAWEELLHLITHVGYGCAFPERWGFQGHTAEGHASSELSRALDAALGSCPASYTGRQGKKQADCHYFYEDPSCFYPCLVNEYLFQAWRTRQGRRSCSTTLRHEYSHCTQELLQQHDTEGGHLDM